MLRLVGLVLSVGLADSLNPTTVTPGLYLATVPRPVVRVAQFTTGVFAVNLAGGLVLTLGPGRLLLGLIPHPHRTAKHVIELVAGDRADPWLRKGQAWLQRQWPIVLAVLLLVIGSGLAVLGGTGLVKQ